MFGVYLPNKPKKVLVLGSGALQIGQAGEFDYSGSQAIKALKEEGVSTVLVNPNIATVQTSEGMADRIYMAAVTPEFAKEVIEKEEADGILLSFGGQTALNCGLALHHRGLLARHAVRVLGTPIGTILDTEDRQRFVERLREIEIKTAVSRACSSIEEARAAARDIGFPIMLRGAFSLGGKGSGIVEDEESLDDALKRAFAASSHQVLVEECLRGWKEIEYEVVRDARDNCITVCNMENMDPMGIHTGESIVVAPSQTLNDSEYQLLRTVAIRTVRHLGVIGECNIQYALDPKSSDYRVIEVNARLSRSSALASKATGYPLAYIAAKLALGYALVDLPNGVTRRTSAFFEPALDYLVCKIPRWDLGKFRGADTRIGTEMKSIGEVMAIGRSFPEVLQKALRMLDIGVEGLDPAAFRFSDLESELRNPTPFRVFAIAKALQAGVPVDVVREWTSIDAWFVHGIAEIVSMQGRLQEAVLPLDRDLFIEAKRLGFSDEMLDSLTCSLEGTSREARRSLDIRPHFAQIDTLAAEFPAETNYLYSSYSAIATDSPPTQKRKVIVLGSGVYRIGSSVEFDWCCVNAVKAAADQGYETLMINFNPETVSTDYDVCDKLFFDELSLENIIAIHDSEKPVGVVVSMGGQVPNNLAIQLHDAGVNVLGTSPSNIDTAEDRSKFSALLDILEIDQPQWAHVRALDEAENIVERLGGFPVLVRPSYVLSGAAMCVAYEPHQLAGILARAVEVSPKHPVVVSKFETHAREVEVDAVADEGELVLWAISEHIENAGVHSGDATLVLPPQTLYIPTIRRVKDIASKIAQALQITGPFNIQFIAKHNVVKVIECNLRASRSFPFASKVTGQNFAAEALRRMIGVRSPTRNDTLNLDYVGVKAPMFSYARVLGADPVLGVEMNSTGEVGCLGDDLHEALLHALLSTGFVFPKRGVLLSLGPVADKYWFTEEAAAIVQDLRLPIFATPGTARMLKEVGIGCTEVEKQPGGGVSGMDLIDSRDVDLVITVTREYDAAGRSDVYLIRRRAVEAGIPLITDLQLAIAVIEALRHKHVDGLQLTPWDHYVRMQ